MPQDSRARLIAYLCQAGLSTPRANAVLDQYTHALADRQRQFAEKRYNDDAPPIPYAGYLGMLDAADSIDPMAEAGS
ncbi:hypothetical protein [Streptomyces bacillaris]